MFLVLRQDFIIQPSNSFTPVKVLTHTCTYCTPPNSVSSFLCQTKLRVETLEPIQYMETTYIKSKRIILLLRSDIIR